MNEARKEEGRAVRAGQTQMEKLCLAGGTFTQEIFVFWA